MELSIIVTPQVRKSMGADTTTGVLSVSVADGGAELAYVGCLIPTRVWADSDRSPNGGYVAVTPEPEDKPKRFNARPRKGRGRREARRGHDGMRGAQGRGAAWLLTKWLNTATAHDWLAAGDA